MHNQDSYRIAQTGICKISQRPGGLQVIDCLLTIAFGFGTIRRFNSASPSHRRISVRSAPVTVRPSRLSWTASECFPRCNSSNCALLMVTTDGLKPYLDLNGSSRVGARSFTDSLTLADRVTIRTSKSLP